MTQPTRDKAVLDLIRAANRWRKHFATLPEKLASALADEALATLYEWMREIEINETLRCIRWQDDGTLVLEDMYDQSVRGHFAVTILVEPVAQWRAGTWEDVANLDDGLGGIRVRLAGQVATVQHAVIQHWHVDPRSSSYRPVPLDHKVVRVVLADRGAYSFPPDGQVEISTGGPVGPAVAALANQFDLSEIKEQS